MKFWQSMAFCEPDQCAELARHAEELGFEGMTLAEHQFFPERLDSLFPFSPDGAALFDAEDEWPEMWPLIGAMATTTKRLRFCTSVHILPLFHPLTVARSAATAEALAPGRIVLGVGAGWMEEEYRAFGIDFASRGRRLEECIEILRLAWTGEMIEFHGEFFEFERLLVRPAPTRSIPVWIGGTSGPALRRAGRIAEGWMGGGGPSEELVDQLESVRVQRVESGREHLAFETMTLHAIGLQRDFDDVRRLADAGLGGVVHLPFRATLGRRSSLSEKRAYLDRFADEVMSEFI
ncbi:MAG: TIGR03619 family F420-dependent LLM class oxidoreductase [bacterium]|nr:TIGR03619 family F420-dependent LLM class oxidoreductase [bacterium]